VPAGRGETMLNILEELRKAQRLLDDMTTEEFSNGADKPVREIIQDIICELKGNN
jgi:hypothetical protein